MGQKLRSIHRAVKKYDRHLYAVQTFDGMIQVHRKLEPLEASHFHLNEADPLDLKPEFIIALTDNWEADGSVVDHGIESIWAKLQQMDSWNRTTLYEDMCKRREREKEDRERSNRNEIRARAADLRRDFAQATNDINTSTLEKVDHRRNYDGNR